MFSRENIYCITIQPSIFTFLDQPRHVTRVAWTAFGEMLIECSNRVGDDVTLVVLVRELRTDGDTM